MRAYGLASLLLGLVVALAQPGLLVWAPLFVAPLALGGIDRAAEDLRALCAKTYTAEVFGSAEIVPLRELEDATYLEALSNGPTLAFKDMAMQLLGNLFEYELGRRGETLSEPLSRPPPALCRSC